MENFVTRFCTALCSSRRISTACWLLAASLLAVAIVPAWAKAGIHAGLNDISQSSEEHSIAVIYPDVPEPYRSVFAQIIGGIEEKARGQVITVAMGAEVNPGELNESLRRQGIKVVIALGRQGMKAASVLDRNIAVVVGGVLAAQSNDQRNMQVNILSPDPALLFSRLKGMMPKVRRVFVVYDPRHNEWMIRLAKSAARNQGLELIVYEAQDLRSAMRAYQDIFATVDRLHDALWLPQDSTSVEESTMLPLVLQESWAHKLSYPRQSRGFISISPSKGQKRDAPKGAGSHA